MFVSHFLTDLLYQGHAGEPEDRHGTIVKTAEEQGQKKRGSGVSFRLLTASGKYRAPVGTTAR